MAAGPELKTILLGSHVKYSLGKDSIELPNYVKKLTGQECGICYQKGDLQLVHQPRHQSDRCLVCPDCINRIKKEENEPKCPFCRLPIAPPKAKDPQEDDWVYNNTRLYRHCALDGNQAEDYGALEVRYQKLYRNLKEKLGEAPGLISTTFFQIQEETNYLQLEEWYQVEQWAQSIYPLLPTFDEYQDACPDNLIKNDKIARLYYLYQYLTEVWVIKEYPRVVPDRPEVDLKTLAGLSREYKTALPTLNLPALDLPAS